MTSTTVTPERFGSLNPRLTREACRRVSRTNRPSNSYNCLPVRFDLTVVIGDSLNHLNPRAIPGEMTTPSGTGACDVRSTGTETDSVFAHAAPHSGPCAGQPPNDDAPCRTNWRHRTLAAKTSPAPASVGLARRDHPPLSQSLSRPNPTVARTKSHGGTGHRTRLIRRYLALPPTTTRTDARPLTLCLLRIPARKSASAALPLGVRHADESEPLLLLVAGTTDRASDALYHSTSRSWTETESNLDCSGANDERRQDAHPGRRRLAIHAKMCATATLGTE